MSSSHEQRPIGSRRSGKALPSAPPDAFLGSHFRLSSPSTTLAILAGALLLPSLFYPLARDQGVFAYVGALILKGGWPYRDVWEVKPPGIYYTYAAIIGCSGRSMGGVRACDLIAAVATVLLLGVALRRFVAAEAAWLAALLYAALYLRLGFWGMAQAESYANLWTAAAVLAWLCGSGVQAFRRSGVQGSLPEHPIRSSGHPVIGSSVAAGAAAAAALLLKMTALPPLAAALGVTCLLRIRGEGWRPEARRFALFLAGLLAPLALAAGAMALSGAGAAYLEIQRGFVASYVAMPMGASGAAPAGWDYFWHLYWMPAALAMGGLLAAPAPARLLLGAWLSAAFASVAMQRKYFGYHWTPVLLPLAALAGIALVAALRVGAGLCRDVANRIVSSSCPSCDRVQQSPRWFVCAAGALLIAAWSVGRPANGYAATAGLLTGRLRLEEYWKRFGRPYHGDFSFLADAWAADYIRNHTRPTDPVYIWGFEPLTLFLAGRNAPTRFVFAVPLVAPWSPPRWREEFLQELRAHPPVLFGVMRHDAIPHASGRSDDSAAQLEAFPALRAFVRWNYRYEGTIEDLTLYRRRSPAF